MTYCCHNPIDQIISHFSSEKLLLDVDGGWHRTPQLVNLQEIRNYGVFSPKWERPGDLRGTRGREIVKARDGQGNSPFQTQQESWPIGTYSSCDHMHQL